MKNLIIILMLVLPCVAFSQSTPNSLGAAQTLVLEVEQITPTITGTGGTFTLSGTPLDNTTVLLIVDGLTYDVLAGSGITISGTTVTWNNATVGTVLLVSNRCIFKYQKNG
jgi:hypothetical protein